MADHDTTATTSDAGLPGLPLPLLLLDVARDPATGSVEGRSRLSLAVRAACLVELGDAGFLLEDGRTLRVVSPRADDLRETFGTTVAGVARELAADADGRSARHWVNRKALTTFDAGTDELVARGDWEPTRSGLLARSSPRFEGAEGRTEALRDLLQQAVTGDGVVAGPRTRDLALLLEACRGLSNVLPAALRREAERRVRGWADLDDGRPVARAAVAAVRSSSAAYLAAVAS